MLGVGWTEMLVIGVVALIVIGPKDLPMLMARLGKAVAAIRRMGNEFQREINKTTGLDAVTDLRKSITDPLKSVASEITREFNRPTATGVEPSGVLKPAIAGGQSVVEEIHKSVGMTPPGAMMTAKPAAVESPAPVEAIAPVAKRVRTTRPKVALDPNIPTTAKPPARSVRAKAIVAAAESAKTAAKPARKPRSPKPKPEA